MATTRARCVGVPIPSGDTSPTSTSLRWRSSARRIRPAWASEACATRVASCSPQWRTYPPKPRIGKVRRGCGRSDLRPHLPHHRHAVLPRTTPAPVCNWSRASWMHQAATRCAARRLCAYDSSGMRRGVGRCFRRGGGGCPRDVSPPPQGPLSRHHRHLCHGPP